MARVDRLTYVGWGLAVALSISPATVLNAQSWAVGQEREVDEGYYLTLEASVQGWRLWKIETRDGVRCKAIKSAEGRPHPAPVGVADIFYGGAPFVEVSEGIPMGQSGPIYRFRLRGTYSGGRIQEFRQVGERFWSDWDTRTDLEPFDGERIEVHVVTYEYPAIYVGRAEDRGVINLVGLSDMVERIRSCEAGL